MSDPARPKASPPGDLPLPPAEFGRTELKLVQPATSWLRLHHRAYRAITFSKAERSRWDCAGPYGALCLGASLAGVVLERFGDQLRGNGRFLTATEIREFKVTAIELNPPPPVFDLQDQALHLAGVDSRLFSGSYRVSRAYSRVFMEHPAEAHGLLYNSRHNPALTNLVLFGRDKRLRWIRARKSWFLKNHPDFAAMVAELKIAIG